MNKTDFFEQQIDEMIAGSVLAGASYGFLEGGVCRLCYRGMQGQIPPYSNRPLSTGMYYDLASLSKVVGTTTRVLQLVEAGKVELSTEVSRILPQFSYPQITVEHLLLHSSGFPAEIRNKESWSRKDLLSYFYTTDPIAMPGEQFVYSDVGFIWLGKIIEQLDQISLEESFQTHIFGPLNMKHTSFLTIPQSSAYIPTECTQQRGCICGEVHDKKAHLLGPCGSAGLFSTLEDVACFAAAYLRRDSALFGKPMFSRILKQEQFGRTLGWSLEYGKGTLYHTGFTGTSILLDVCRNRGLVLLTNRVHPTRDGQEFLHRRKQLNQCFLEME